VESFNNRRELRGVLGFSQLLLSNGLIHPHGGEPMAARRKKGAFGSGKSARNGIIWDLTI
jgi:hypothetical protein